MRRSLGDRLGQSGDGELDRDQDLDLVNKSVMSKVVKVRQTRRRNCGASFLFLLAS